MDVEMSVEIRTLITRTFDEGITIDRDVYRDVLEITVLDRR